jgi:hypothetical protein
MKQARQTILLAFLLVAGLVGYFWFPQVDLARQLAMAQFLATTAATLFAILGVWIAVLDPRSLLDSPEVEEPTASRALASELLRPWLYATSVFAIAVVHAFILGAAGSLWDHFCIVRQISGGFLTLLLLLLLDTLLGTLLPVAHLQRRERERRLRGAYRR